ncbi:uncharacterized protein STAUR_7511 [Stigmatella aurantiaca DW4/3-1]|uniref:Uncharacterized protein n=1 Tax=Stigmatella aurantiaca (strain DW4/3-1) TaxID=378806 RepID=E3FG07_STIAD|nr:uncharacterized protein STAUR_7511 [Stigmatella aurantiaca DW4/3-1]
MGERALGEGDHRAVSLKDPRTGMAVLRNHSYGPQRPTAAAAQNKKAEVDIVALLIAHAQAPLPMEPRVGPRSHPAAPSYAPGHRC